MQKQVKRQDGCVFTLFVTLVLLILLILISISSLRQPLTTVSYVFENVFLRRPKYPNFVLILTDDQDITLNGMHPMKFSRSFFEDGGVRYDNAFVSTPVCCPSRASLLTGRYQHNTGVLNNTVAGNCCGADWRQKMEPRTFAARLHRSGYNTFYAGKYLNQYGYPPAGGVSHVPPGWDWWVGLVGNSRYYNYTLSVNGTAQKHGDHYADDYLTDVIKRYALEFLRGRSPDSAPFLLMVAPPAPHAPQTPAPQHAHLFPGARAPRTASYNSRPTNKHRLLQEPPAPLRSPVLDTMDRVYRDRWRALVSVDRMVEAVVTRLREMGALEETYLLYTSDHGYHLGQFSLTVDKRQPYEFDLRVPLYLRGGGLPAGRAVRSAVSAVDLAPTVLRLAGLEGVEQMDGVPLTEPISVEAGVDLTPSSATPEPEPPPPRAALLVSYNGEANMAVEARCRFRGLNVSHCYEQYACKCQDSADNTYRCIREMAEGVDRIVCRFTQPEEFWEVYDLSSDPDQLMNMAPSLTPAARDLWRRRLAAAERCSGHSCRRI